MALLAISGRQGSGKDTVGLIIQYLTDELNKTNPKEFTEWVDGGFHASDWEIKKYAGKLKEIVALLTGCTVEDLESQEFKMKELGPEWQKVTRYKTYDELTHNQKERVIGTPADKYLVPEEWIPDYRWLLQTIGTDALRNVVHENIWVNALMADYSKNIWDPTLNDFIEPNWFITDMRFPNEMDAVKAKGGITIRVNRPYSTTGGNGIPATFSQTQFHPSETALDDHKFDYVIDNDGSLSDLVDKVKDILIKEKII